MTHRLREDLIATARRMSELGLTPGLSGNASVRASSTSDTFFITPSGLPYATLTADDAVALPISVSAANDGTPRPGSRTPSSEWRLHRDLLAARPDITAIVHTHSLFCTAISMLRRPIPAVHYSIVLANSDEIPCADYATFGSPDLAISATRALGTGNACLLANHGMVALGASLDEALRLAAEIETLASQYWHAAQLGTPHVLDRDELLRVRSRFATYGQRKRGR